jgi:putative ABC transport system permease protein
VNAAQVKGTVNANFRGEYDLLVLPRGSVQTGAGKRLAGLSAGLALLSRHGGLGLHVPLSRALLVLPVAITLAGVSGLVPAWTASRIPPAHALMPAARAPRRGGRRVRTVTGLAITGIVRTPGRSAVAAAGLAVGVADLTYLNLRERAGELAALAASGWGRRQFGRLLTSEAVVTAVTGSDLGAAIGLTAAGFAFGLTLPVLATAAIAAAGGTAVTLAAVLTVLLLASGRPLAVVLAADE